MLIYKIVNKDTGLEWKSYTNAWNVAKWRKNGKIWSKLCHAKSAMRHIPESDKSNARIMSADVSDWTEYDGDK